MEQKQSEHPADSAGKVRLQAFKPSPGMLFIFVFSLVFSFLMSPGLFWGFCALIGYLLGDTTKDALTGLVVGMAVTFVSSWLAPTGGKR